MRRLRSTPLRLAVLLIAVFTVFLSAGLATAYALMHQTLSAEISRRADQVADELRAISNPGERLVRAAEIAAAADRYGLLIRYELGGLAVGNLPPLALPGGVVSAKALGLKGELAEDYLLRRSDLAPGLLVVLIGRDSLSELQETFIAILGFSLLPALMLTSAIGMVMVRRTGQRVEAIRGTLHQLAGGALGARVGEPHPDTDLGDISRDLDRMAEAQEAATEALRQIGSDIAHDLKTPIQRVAVQLERLEQSDLPEAARPRLEAAQAETAAIIDTFQSLLQIAQLEGGQGREGFGPVDLAALLSDMADIYAPAVEETGASLTCKVTAPEPIIGDRHHLSRLIANLVENAIRHAPGTLLLLSLSGRVLTVQDGGPGIPAERRGDVLRRLVRLEASRTTPGSGLGLAMVKAIADQHGATLTLGDAGPGLIVSVAFPAP